jgi:long-chain acyl-CoA synthetase
LTQAAGRWRTLSRVSSAVTQPATREGLALDAATLCEAFQRTAETHAERVALRTPGGEDEITWGEYAGRVRKLAAGLAALGVARGDTVAIMLANRPEAVIVDTAAMHLGAIPFSIYNTSSFEQAEYLLAHAQCRVVVTEAQFAELVLDVAERLPALEHVFLDRRRGGGRASRCPTSNAGGREDFDLESAWRQCQRRGRRDADLHLGHDRAAEGGRADARQPHGEARLLDCLFPVEPAGRVVSYLPMAHLADRGLALREPGIGGVRDVRQRPAAADARRDRRAPDGLGRGAEDLGEAEGGARSGVRRRARRAKARGRGRCA